MIAVADFPKETRPFEPRGNAITLLKSRRRELLLAGPAGTGKSLTCLQKLHICARKYPRSRLLIVRKSRASITQTAMVTYEQKVLPEGWLGNIVHFRTQEQQYEYPNGSVIAVGGIDKPSKIMSSEWDIIYVMEATELSENDLESLTTRLRNGVLPYQQIIMDCNPSAPAHWLKRRCDRGITRMLESRHEDNPTITPAYLATLDALTGVRLLRLRKGIWAAAEGMVYTEWEPGVHLVSRESLKDRGVFYADGTLNRQVIRHIIGGIDWGYTNPGVLQVWGIDGDWRMYLLAEMYRTQRTTDWWVEQAQALDREFHVEQWIADPSEPGDIRKFNQAGLPTIGADNAIRVGIKTMKSYLEVKGDGRARMYIYEYALRDRDELRDEANQPVCFEGEINELVWPKGQDGQVVKEVPAPGNDHSMDTARYVCMHVDGTMAGVTDDDRDTLAALRRYRGN